MYSENLSVSISYRCWNHHTSSNNTGENLSNWESLITDNAPGLLQFPQSRIPCPFVRQASTAVNSNVIFSHGVRQVTVDLVRVM